MQTQTRDSKTNYNHDSQDKNGAEPSEAKDSPRESMMIPSMVFLQRSGSQMMIDENPLTSRSNSTTSTARE